VTLSFTSPDAARYRLAGLAHLVRVLQPAHVRHDLVAHAKRALSVNGDDGPRSSRPH
jgi:hypothetical protein